MDEARDLKGGEVGMTVKCELFDYKSPGPLDNPKVVIEDDGVLNSRIRISIDDKWAVVDAGQLEKAISACTRLPN